MSLRIATAEWIPGSLIIGGTGLGVLGQNIPSTGMSGPGYTYNDLSLPADNLKEICGRLTALPSAGTLHAYEDTSFTFVAPDGVYTAQYQLYVDGVATGSPATIFFDIGNIAITTALGTLSLTGFAPGVSIGATGTTPGAGAVTLLGFAPSAQTSGQLLPGVGSLSLSTFAPDVETTGTTSIIPDCGVLTLAGFGPECDNSSPECDPLCGSVTLTGFTPLVSQFLSSFQTGPIPVWFSKR